MVSNLGEPRRRVDGFYDVNIVSLAGLEVVERLFAADLTTDGVQYSDIFETGEMHVADDSTNTVSSANQSSQGTGETLANEMKGDYNTHIADTAYHTVADTTNAIVADDANDLPSLITLLTELRADYNAHRTESGIHVNDDGLNITVAAIPTDLSECQTLNNELKEDFNLHLLATVQATYETALTKTVDPGAGGDVLVLEMGLTFELYGDADNSAGKFKWQGRNANEGWSDIVPEVTDSDVDIVVQPYTYSGYVQSSIISTLPFEVRLQIKCDLVGKTVLAKVKNNSYIRVVYKAG